MLMQVSLPHMMSLFPFLSDKLVVYPNQGILLNSSVFQPLKRKKKKLLYISTYHMGYSGNQIKEEINIF